MTGATLGATLGGSTSGRAASPAARERFEEIEGRPLFLSDWVRAFFVHYEVPPELLQRQVPFELDLLDGRAYVSLVAFTMRRLRLAARSRTGRAVGRLLVLPGASHELLNVRTYVRHGGERGIFFMTEWIPNALSVLIGPRTFGLPYRLGALEYRHEHEHERGRLRGVVTPRRSAGRIEYVGDLGDAPAFEPCAEGTRGEFLLERYTAFTRARSRSRMFRIWHEPWRQAEADISMLDESALRGTGPWFEDARLVGANYTPGVHDVWIGRPRAIS